MGVGVAGEGVAAVAVDAEEGPRPERGEFGEVRGPVHVCDVVEHGPEQVVGVHVAVEAVDHVADLLDGVKIGVGHKTVLLRGCGSAQAARRPSAATLATSTMP